MSRTFNHRKENLKSSIIKVQVSEKKYIYKCRCDYCKNYRYRQEKIGKHLDMEVQNFRRSGE